MGHRAPHLGAEHVGLVLPILGRSVLHDDVDGVAVALEAEVDDFEADLPGMLQAHRIDVADNDDRRPQQARRGGRRQTNRSGTGDIDGRAGADTGRHRAVEAGRQDIGQAGQVADLGHRLRLVRKAQQVEVRVRHHHVLGLAADPAAHVDVAVGAAGARGIHRQAHAGVLFLAGAAAPAGDVERDRDQVAQLQRFDVGTEFDHFPGNFVAKHEAGRCGGAPAHHVLVGPADIGRDHFQDHAMPDLPAARRFQLRKRDRVDLDLALFDVDDTAVFCHFLVSSLWVLLTRHEPDRARSPVLNSPTTLRGGPWWPMAAR